MFECLGVGCHVASGLIDIGQGLTDVSACIHALAVWSQSA